MGECTGSRKWALPVQREDCYPSDQVTGEQNSVLKSLQICLTYDTEITDSLPLFLATIGPTLQHLVIVEPTEALDVGMILQSCPNLDELNLCGRVIEFHLTQDSYVFDPNESCLPTEWNQVEEIAKCLSDTRYALVRCVRQLGSNSHCHIGMKGMFQGPMMDVCNVFCECSRRAQTWNVWIWSCQLTTISMLETSWRIT